MVLSMEEKQNDLLHAIRNMDCDAVREILHRHHLNPRLFSVDVNEGLIAAVKTAHCDIVRLLLLQKSANVMCRDEQGQCAIHYAAEGASPYVLELVIKAGAALNAIDKDGFTPLHLAARSGNIRIINLLLREGVRVRRSPGFFYVCGESPLHLAAKSGKMSAVRLLILKGADVDAVCKNDRATALHKAVAGRHNDVAMFLIKAGTDVNMQDSHGRSVLHTVAKSGKLEICQLLLEHGAKTHITDQKGRTPLHWAMGSSQHKIAEFLLEADHTLINVQDQDGLTVLHHAAVIGSVDDAVLLLNYGAEIDKQEGREGVTALGMAISNNNLEFAQVLVYSGASVQVTDHAGSTPLHRVQACRHTDKCEMAELLIEYGAKLNPMTSQGYTPLDRCVFQFQLRNYSRKLLQLLVVNGACLKPLEGPGGIHRNSPLCWLVWRGDLESARYLVSVGWDINQENWINLPGKTSKQSEFLLWLQEQARQVNGLAELCRSTIRTHLSSVSDDSEITSYVEPLPLPKNLKKYLLFHDESEDLLTQEA